MPATFAQRAPLLTVLPSLILLAGRRQVSGESKLGAPAWKSESARPRSPPSPGHGEERGREQADRGALAVEDVQGAVAEDRAARARVRDAVVLEAAAGQPAQTSRVRPCPPHPCWQRHVSATQGEVASVGRRASGVPGFAEAVDDSTAVVLAAALRCTRDARGNQRRESGGNTHRMRPSARHGLGLAAGRALFCSWRTDAALHVQARALGDADSHTV